MSAPAQAQPNCPWYGRHMAIVWPSVERIRYAKVKLIGDSSEQCGLMIDIWRACTMSVGGDVPDWRTCPWVKEQTVGPKAVP